MDPNPLDSPRFVEAEATPTSQAGDHPLFVVLGLSVVVALSFVALILQSSGGSGYQPVSFFGLSSMGLLSAWLLR